MEICSKNHDEIVFEKQNRNDQCPFCKMISDKDEEIEKLNNKISDLKNEIRELE